MTTNNQQAHADQHLVEGIAANNRAVIQQIYKQFYPSVRQYIRKNSGKEKDAEDLFQEAMIAIFQRLKKGPLPLFHRFTISLNCMI